MKSLSSDVHTNILRLTNILNKHVAQFEEALVGSSLNDICCIFCGDSSRLLSLLRQNAALVSYLLEFKKSDAIFFWNLKYVEMHVCTNYVESILNQLCVIKLKSKFHNPSDTSTITEFVQSMKKEILLFKIDMHQLDGVTESVHLFKLKLLRMLENQKDLKDITILKACIQNDFIFGLQAQSKDSFFQRQDDVISTNTSQSKKRHHNL